MTEESEEGDDYGVFAETRKGWTCGCGFFNETEGDVSGCEHECASCGRRTFVEEME